MVLHYIAILSFGRERLTLLFHAIRNKSKTNPSSFARVIPSFSCVSYVYLTLVLIGSLYRVPFVIVRVITLAFV